MERGVLRGYKPNEAIGDEARAAFGAAFPLFVAYVIDELIPAHVLARRQEAARSDALSRIDELISEARWNTAVGRPEAASTWYITKRDHAFARPATDLRRRRRKVPPGPVLLREYEELRLDLRRFLPRRRLDEPVSSASLQQIQRSYPELAWSRPGDSAGVTPSEAARIVLARKYGVQPGRVRKILEETRRER